MSWRDNLVEASYKGAAFRINASNTSVGRRTSLHQYINRDKPFLEDLGSEAEKFAIEGYIIQTASNSFDYMFERDTLIRALKSKGPGILIHPFYGIKRVGLLSEAKITETFTEGGIARFSMTFVEAGERVLPIAIPDFLNKIDNAVNKVYDAVGDFFFNVYTTTGAFTDIASNSINKSIATIQTSITGIQAIPTKVISEVTGNINSIRNTVDDIADSPNDVYNSIKDSCNSLAVACGMGDRIKSEQGSTTGTPGEGDVVTEDRVTDSYANSISISAPVIGGETGNYSGITRGDIKILDGDTIPDVIGKSVLRTITNIFDTFETSEYKTTPDEQQVNVVMIFHIMKLCLLANACRIAVRTVFFSQEDVVEYREMILQVFEDFMLDVGAVAADGGAGIDIGTGTDPIWNQEIFISVEEMRDLFAESMSSKITEIPSAVDYETPPDGKDCLSLAYDKYEDLSRYLEIYKRNRNIIRHPGFIPQNETIRILEE